MRPLITFEKVDVAIEGQVILRDISWRLMPGEHWAVLGGNGAGKSTFLKLIRAELGPAPNRGRRTYALNGRAQTSAVGVKERIALVSPELQNRYLQQEWRLTGLQVIHSGFGGGDYAYQKPGRRQRSLALETAELVGAAHLCRRNVQELSTGELRKVLIARALVGGPRVLVCDEICDGLDEVSRLALLATLEAVARKGTQLLCATHRMDEMIPSLTHKLVLSRGRLTECGKLSEGGGRGVSRKGAPQKTGTQSRAGAPPPGRSRRNGPALFRIRRGNVFLNGRRVLRSINWEVRTGEHWAVLGRNGAGKSTLLKLVAGDLQAAWGGSVRRFEFTSSNTIWEVKRRIGQVSPELQTNYRGAWTGAQAISSGFFASIGIMRALTGAQKQRVAEVIDILELDDLAHKKIGEMSYGEFRKILLGRALVHRPALLVCDEPFDGLDSTTRREMSVAFGTVAELGTTLLLVTHHREDLPGCISHVAELDNGRMTFRGSVDEFRNMR